MVSVTTSAAQTSKRLPAVDPNVSKVLAIVALSQTTFGLVSLYLNNYAAEICYFEYFLGFLVSHQGDEEEGKGYKSATSCRRGAFRPHLLDAYKFVAQLYEGHCKIFRRGVTR
jgi:hypothetical protein